MYEIYLERSVERSLKKISSDDFQRIISPIKKLANNPRPKGCRKISGSNHDWRIRVGDYRILYEIEEKEKVIRVMRIKHRKEAYR